MRRGERTLTRSLAAPVNAPLVWPNRSLSISVSVEAPQSKTTNGPSRAGRSVVDTARHQLLAGAALAEEQDRRGRLRSRARAPRTPGASAARRRRARRTGRWSTAGYRATSSAGMSWTSVLPIRSATPGGATTFCTATPSITVPFFEPRSVIAKPRGGRRDRAVAARHERVGQHDVARALGADHDADRRQLDLEPAIGTIDDAQLSGAHRRSRRDGVRDPGDQHGQRRIPRKYS